MIVANQNERYNGQEGRPRTPTGRASRQYKEEHATMIDLLGLVLCTTVIIIGLLDLKSGLGPFAMYRSGALIGGGPQTPATGRHDDDNRPRPPAPAP
jgi:hypothetical protein